MRKRSVSSAHDKPHVKSAKHIADSEIDFSDIPESTDDELRRARRVGRPRSGRRKQLMAFRIDPSLLQRVRRLASNEQRAYQTLLHEMIESATKHLEMASGVFATRQTSAARGVDQQAFGLILAQYAQPVASFIYDQVANHELAEELTQETFVRAIRGLKTLRSEAKLSTWLFAIAKNVTRESLRARMRQNEQVDLVDLIDPAPVPVSQLMNKELNEVVQRALTSLDEDKRLVFTLKVFHQYSYEEIAKITGFSIPKLKTDLHRARTEMRQRVGKYVRQ